MSNYKWDMSWRTDDMTDEQRKELVAALPTLTRLRATLQRKLDASAANQLKLSNYDSPSWGYLQADYIATKRILKEIQLIITPSVNKD